MSLRDQLEKSGAWLFKYRSYLPLLILPVFGVCLAGFKYLGQSHRINEAWQMFCMWISFAGLAVRILIVGRAPLGTSGRNTREQVANSLTTTGIYSVVRHPLYLGNFLIMCGFSMVLHIWWLPLLTACVYALYYERIMLTEEAFLRERFGKSFEDWAAVTPAFIPKLTGFRPSPVPFCWRTVLQREYNGFFLIVTVSFLLDLFGDSLVEGRIKLSPAWFGAFLAAFAITAALRTIKKRTRLLHVEGR
jgi:protein-S-isoprenylcysteine O-methyltransferase Ste14